MKKKLIIIIPIIIALLTFVFVYRYYNKEDKTTTLTVREKQWVQENKEKTYDFEVVNDYPLYGLNGEGVIFRFLDDFEENIGLEFNRIPYLKESETSTDSFRIRILDNNQKIGKNDLSLFNDNYVAVGKTYQRLNSIKDFKNITFGVFKEDASEISYYLKSATNLSYKNYDDIEDLYGALDKDEVDMIIVPNIMYLNYTIENDKYSINYFFTEMQKQIVLTLSKNNYYKILNEIKNELLNESKILQLISNYYGEEYTKNLRELEIKNESEDVADYLTVLVEQSIIKDNLKKVEITQKETNVTTKFVFTNNDGNIVMNTYENDEIINEAKLKVDGKNFDLQITSETTNPITIKGNTDNDFYVYNMSIPINDVDTIGLNYRFKNTIGSNLTYENSFTINVQQDTFTLNNTGTISSLGQEINVDTSNYIDYEQINTQQLQTRYARVLEPLINVIVGTNTL